MLDGRAPNQAPGFFADWLPGLIRYSFEDIHLDDR